MSKPFTLDELLAIAVAREIHDYENVVLGVGVPMTAGALAKALFAPHAVLMMESGIVDIRPLLSLNNIADAHSCRGFSYATDLFSAFTATYRGFVDVCFLGVAQVDKYGNVNATKVDGQFIAGSGGSNDAANAQEVMVISRQSPKRFVDRVDYITSPGIRVKTLVSDLGIFEKLGADEQFTLTGVHASGADLEEKVQAVRANCGWDLKVAPAVREMTPPDVEELGMIRCFDPNALYR
jgi:glutaconate CoA-transferase subunit B